MGRSSLCVIALLFTTTLAHADSDCMSAVTCRPLCDKGDAHACGVLGEQYTRMPDAQGNQTWLTIGVKFLDMACTKNDADACQQLGMVLGLMQVDDRSIPDKRIADAQTRL